LEHWWESPDLTDREQARVAMSSKVVVAWIAAVRMPGRLSNPCQKERTVPVAPHAGPASSQYRAGSVSDKEQCGGGGCLALKRDDTLLDS